MTLTRRNFLAVDLAAPPGTAPPPWTAGAHVAGIGPGCLVGAGVACMTCADICPEAAIRLRPRIGAPATPELDEGLCSGCGACAAVCPAAAIRPKERAHD